MKRAKSNSLDNLRGPVLRSVSRSFYLSIRLLPAALRDPIALAYLLARATDTIADTADIDAKLREESLRKLARAIQGNATEGDIARFTQFVRAASKKRSGTQFDRIIADYSEVARSSIGGPIAPMCGLFWRKSIAVNCSTCSASVRTNGVRALSTENELDEYTYLVAGCVGEFWTDLCFRHLPKFADRSTEEMRTLGRAYGKGLQLINILRDAGSDFRNGRCYFPEEELKACRRCA